MEKILVSACLVGDNTRYDGKNCKNNEIIKLNEKFDFILCCPEVQGGLKTPREPFEILNGKAVTLNGRDITNNIEKGIAYYENIIRFYDIKVAILKELSPSCGKNKIYDGTFRNRIVPGSGLFVKKLRELGVDVYTENELEEFKQNYVPQE